MYVSDRCVWSCATCKYRLARSSPVSVFCQCSTDACTASISAATRSWCVRLAIQKNNIIIIIIISTTMFMVLSSWQSHCESSPGSFDECRMAPSGHRPKTKPYDLGCESACIGCQKLHPPSTFIITQLSPKADTHFTVPRRVKGWVDLAGWLHTEMVYPSTDGHPSEY